MEKVLELIRDKKIRAEGNLYKAKLITERSETMQKYIDELEDYCSQLTKAEKILNEGSVAASSKVEDKTDEPPHYSLFAG